MTSLQSWQSLMSGFDPEENLEIVTLDEITEQQYDDFVENNDGIERG